MLDFFNHCGFFPNWVSTFFCHFQTSTVEVISDKNIFLGEVFKLIFEFFKKSDLLVRDIRGIKVH